METTTANAVLLHCKRLTRKGEELKVTWNGGNDSGWFETWLNDENGKIDDGTELEIIDFIGDFVGYGSFAGDFNTEGSVIYNPESECFEGHDNYSQTENDVLFCELLVGIPESIWFDAVDIHYEANAEGAIEEVSVQLVVNNGPYTDAHESTAENVSLELKRLLKAEIAKIDADLSSVWEDITLPRSALEADGDELLLRLEEIPYVYYKYTNKALCIPLVQ